MIVNEAETNIQEWGDLVENDRVHRTLYTDSQVFAAEMDHIFAGNWVFVLHESEIAEPGDYRQAWIGTREVFVTRDNDGQVNVLFNRCSHRGAVICREFRGKSSSFTCPYHGWRYDARGNLFGVPGKNAYGPTFKSRNMHLAKPAKVESYKGFVFSTLNPDAKPLTEHLGNARAFIDAWIEHNGGEENIIVSGAQRFQVNSNWKMIYDNAGDGYHVPFSHQSLLVMTKERYGGGDMEYFADADSSQMYLYALDNGHTVIDQRPDMFAESAWGQQRPQPGREVFEEHITSSLDASEQQKGFDKAVGAGMNLSIFPNLLFIGNQIQVLQPIDVSKTAVHFHATQRADVDAQTNTMRLRTQEDFPILGEMDDADNFEECQRGISNAPEDEWIDISRHYETGKDADVENGIRMGPVTSEIHMRNYYSQWKRLMTVQPKLEVSKERVKK